MGGNCYESFDGVVDIGKAFCERFPPSSSGKMLNMFSTVDHSKFCIAHVWTYRDLDVVGLADSPTEVRSRFSDCGWLMISFSAGWSTKINTNTILFGLLVDHSKSRASSSARLHSLVELKQAIKGIVHNFFIFGQDSYFG